MDDIDQMLKGADDPSLASQAEQGDQSTEAGQPSAPAQQSPEEVEFNRLPGSTRDRITTFVSRLREKDAELERLRASVVQAPVPPAPGTVQNPLQTLSQAGVALKEDVTQSVNQMRHEFEMNRLESRFTGTNGEPQFSRAEYEEYVNTHPQYQYYSPEDVFKYKMFETEFNGLRGAGVPQTGRSSTLRPTGTQTRQDTMTPEYIEERLKQPDGQEWYAQNLDKINATISNMNPNQ